MTDWAIRGSDISKEFVLGVNDLRRQTLREAIMDLFFSPFQRFRTLSGGERRNAFWALRDVNLEVKAGEVLGLIGRNGAGKSTLLKVLGRITAPTTGRIEMRGRVASLLEVGTGFHPELSGRENIYLNGAILGMSREEIARKFDEIVEFAGVEKFLDTPVKRYSSGMYVRLAFAVAANIEPEILLIDEVLAVGDLEFQKKCLDRMRDMASGSSTVIFVSHNMGAIQALCNSCLLLEQGRSISTGPSSEIVAQYVAQRVARASYERTLPPRDKPSVDRADVEILPKDAQTSSWRVRLHMTVSTPTRMSVAIGLRIRDQMAIPVAFASRGHFGHDEMVQLKVGQNPITLELPIDNLALGSYTVTIRMSVPYVTVLEELDDCLTFSVDRAPRPGASLALPQSWGYGGVELPLYQV